MDILFFDGYSRDPSKWKSAWTQCNHPGVCWPEKWLPADLGFESGCCSCRIMVNPVSLMLSTTSSKLLSSGMHLSGHRDCRSGIALDWIPVGLMNDWKPPGKSSTSSRNDEMDGKFRSQVIEPLTGTLLCVCAGTSGIYARIISLLR